MECGEVEREVFSSSRGVGISGREEEEEEGVEGGMGDGDKDEDEDEEGGGVSLTSFISSDGSGPGSSSRSTAAVEGIVGVRSDGRGEGGLSSQQRGVRKAKEREMVRQAARRGVAFGFEVEGEGEGARRKVDCVRGGRVVESSFAKGEWGVRWRE